MKRFSTILLIAAIAAVSCGKPEFSPEVEDGLSAMSFRACSELTSKTVITDSRDVNWVQGDLVGVYDGTAWRQFTASSSGKETTLEGSASESSIYYAVYPYCSTSNFDAGAIKTVFPAEQVLSSASVAPGAVLAVSSCEGPEKEFSFKNVVSLLKFALDEDDEIVKVEFCGRNSEDVSGDLTVFVSDAPTYNLENGSASVILRKGDDSVISGTTYMTVLPQSFEKGFSLTFTNADGMTASKKYGAVEFVRNGGLDAGTLSGFVWKGIQARSIAQSSSTLTFEWTENKYENVSADISNPYTIALYNDSECTELVVSWNIEASAAIYNSKQPRFVFTGLSSNTTYYFKVTDTNSGDSSAAVSATTSSFTPITVSSTEASVNDVLLAEDFSELVWGTDEYNSAMGYTALTTSASNMTPASGANPVDSYKLIKAGDYSSLFTTFANGVANSRLAGWGTICYNSDAVTTTSSKAASRAGYIMLNTWSGGTASLVTPALTSLAQPAKVRVTFDAAQYPGGDVNATPVAVSVLDSGSSLGNQHVVSFSNKAVEYTSPISTDMATYTCIVEGVEPGCRIAIGPESTVGTKARMYLDNVKVELVEYLSYPIIAQITACTSSTATFKWTENNFDDVEADLANDYTIGVYTDKACTSPVVTWNVNASTFTYKGTTTYQPSFVFTGLASNKTYYFRVLDTTNSLQSNVVPFTTAKFHVRTVTSETIAAGDTLLAEDFSQLVWGSDEINVATGYESRTYSTDTQMTPATGNSPTDVYRYYPYGDYHSLFYWYKTPMQSTRYATWSYLSYLSSALQNDGTSDADTQWDKKINARAGYLMLGTWSNGNGIIVTPPLTNMSGTAKIRVTYKGARYSTDDHNGIAVYVISPEAAYFSPNVNWGLDPSKGTVTMQGKQWLYNNTEIVGKSGQELWQSFSKDVTGVAPGSRIGIGPCNHTGKGERMYVDDIVITVVSYE